MTLEGSIRSTASLLEMTRRSLRRGRTGIQSTIVDGFINKIWSGLVFVGLVSLDSSVYVFVCIVYKYGLFGFGLNDLLKILMVYAL